MKIIILLLLVIIASAADPTIASVSPSGGPLAGGTTVYIFGTNLNNTSSVYFGSIAATGVSIVSDTEITCTTPSEIEATVNVTLTTPGGSVTDSGAYTFQGPFVMVVNTSNAGSSSSNSFTLPLNGLWIYNFNVTWGDGSGTQTITNSTAGFPNITYTYSTPGTYTVAITENIASGFPTINFAGGGDCQKLLQIANWGGNTWNSLNSAFYGCSNLMITATDQALANMGTVTDFSYAWYGCSGLTTFPLLNASSGTNLSYAWYGCSGLTTFPFLNASSGTNLSYAWYGCSGLTTFPLLNTSSGTNLSYAWYGCSGLTTFPLLNTSNVTSFFSTWSNCSGLTSFPLLNTGNGTSFNSAWFYCGNLTSFPALNTSNGTDFSETWGECISLTNFPTINLGNMQGGRDCFRNVTLSTSSYSNLLISIASLNTNLYVTFDGGNSQYSVGAASTARNTTLIAGLIWTITDGGQVPAPTIISVSPNSGPVNGSATVTITGTNMTGTSTVTFGGNAATTVNVISSSSLTCITPAGVIGPANVVLTSFGGSVTATEAYTYQAAPTITSISPVSGPLAGSTTVTITGTNLIGTSGVLLGSTPATTVTVVSSTSMTCATPAEAAGTVSVVLTTPSGNVTDTSAYTYQAAPTITNVSPSVGPLSGGSIVTITGLNLSGTTSVSFGTNAATAVTVTSPTNVTCLPPTGTTGAVSIILAAPGGAVTYTNAYTYQAASVITSALTASGTAGSPFSYQITASNSPTSYNATGLPTGLSINTTTGSITGTPSIAGSPSVSISATNAGGTGTATLVLAINPAAPIISSALTAAGIIGSVFSYQITASNSPTSFNASGLPIGLTINTATGAITGTPTTSATSPVIISAINAGGTGSASLTVTIAASNGAASPSSSGSGSSGGGCGLGSGIASLIGMTLSAMLLLIRRSHSVEDHRRS
jgi:hypothetical protein